MIALSAVVFLAVVILCVYLIIRRFQLHRQGLALTGGSTGGLGLMEGGSSTPVYDLENLKLNTVIHSGRYGEVWKGTLNEIQVREYNHDNNNDKCLLSDGKNKIR